MPSRNRGQKKLKLRDVIRQLPNQKEKDELFNALNKAGSPVVQAIIGQSLVEAMIDELLRPRFKRGNHEVWDLLTDEAGPLGSYRRKVSMAYAMGVYDDITRDALTRIGNIRNGFAHSKKPLSFSHEAVRRELRNVPLPKSARSWLYEHLNNVRQHADANGNGPRDAHITLCYIVYTQLQKTQIKRLKAKTARMKNSSNLGAIAKALLGAPTDKPTPRGGLLTGGLLFDALDPTKDKD